MRTGSAEAIWEAALGELQIQVNKPNYRTWLERTIGLSYEDTQFVIGVPNTFVAEYLDRNQRSLIEKTLTGLTQHNINVAFHVYTKQEAIPEGQPTSPSRFNPKYTFDSFIVGSCNHLAHDAAMEAAQHSRHSYNPLFIYGGVGLGKTHLLHAIGQATLANNMQVLYVSAEQFTNEFINAIRNRNTEAFRNKYRSADMLLIDDIHFISGKEQTEESFFHTFNELHNANRQITITSDRLPEAMPLLDKRLRSRFEWGLIADIQPPDFETRLAILQAKAEQQALNINADVLEFIAQRIHQNIRELEGSLNRLIAYARLSRALPTPELAAQALENIADTTSRALKGAPVTPTLVIEAVANSFQIAPQDLRGRKRDKETALARQVAMYLIKEENNCSLTQIGKELGDRDHHLVSHAYKKIAGDLATNPDLKDRVLDIQQRLYPQKR